MDYEISPQQYRIRWLIAVLAIILGITFFPYIFGGRTFLPSDMIDTMTAPLNSGYVLPQTQNHYIFDALTQTYPYKTQTKEAFEHGKLAYWNPHILAGYPEYAETMANNYDIFNILLLWLNPQDVIHWETVIELFIAGFGMILLLRFFGVMPLVNLLFATAYMLNSLFIVLASNRWLIASFCWMPLVILMILRYFNSYRKENFLYASVFLALAFLGGNFQTSLFVAFVVTIITLCYPSKFTENKLLSRIGILSTVGLIAFALSAVMWLPTLELLFQTLFRDGSLNSPNTYSDYSLIQRLLSLPLLICFFFPALTGNAETFNLKKFAAPDIVNFNGAICFIPTLFALWGCWVLWKNRYIRPFIILSILAFLLPIATPLFNILYHRFFIIASFSFCVIGSISFQSFIQNENVRISFIGFFKWTKILFGALIAILISSCIFISLNYEWLYSKFTAYVSQRLGESFVGIGNASWMQGRAEKTLRYYTFLSPTLWLPILIGAISILALTYYLKDKLSKKNIQLIVFCMTSIELFIFARSWLPSIDPQQFPIYPNNPVASYLQKDTTESRYAPWSDGSTGAYIFPENSSNVYKINDIHGYESCSNRALIVFYKKHVFTDSLDLRLLGLANVKYVVTNRHQVTTPNLRSLYSADKTTIYENLLCKPRAYFAYKSKIVESAGAAGSELLRPDFDGSEAVFTKDDVPSDISKYAEGKNMIHFDRSDNEELSINAQTDSRGIFILTDTYYPGWKCYVNGIQKQIYCVNYCMRGVVLDVGTSRVVFRFEPDIFKAGMGISIVTALLCFGWFLRLKIPGRKK